MTPSAWIALIGVALTGGTTVVILAFKLGVLSQRVDRHDDESGKWEGRLEALEDWRRETVADVKVMRVLLENIREAVNARKTP